MLSLIEQKIDEKYRYFWYNNCVRYLEKNNVGGRYVI